jgi:hypothetical protein
MRLSRVLLAAAVSLSVCSPALAQDPTTLSGVWLLSFKGSPLALLMKFEAGQFRILGSFSAEDSGISWFPVPGERANTRYPIVDFAVEGPTMSYRMKIEGLSLDAMGALPGDTGPTIPTYLFAGGEIVGQLTPIGDDSLFDRDQPQTVQQPSSSQAALSDSGTADGWIATDKGSYRIARFWEETAGSYTATYTIVSYKNTTSKTFTSSVRIKASIYDQNNGLIDTNTRSFFATEYGSMAPGFTGEVKIPIDANPGEAKSVRVTIEIAN